MKESEFKFLGYRISEIRCLIDDNFGKIDESLKHDIKIENNFSKKDPKFVEVVLNITVNSESEKLFFFIKIKGGFQASDEMDDSLFKKLSQQNAPAILFPFARSIITSYTAQANIPPIILPSVNFVFSEK